MELLRVPIVAVLLLASCAGEPTEEPGARAPVEAVRGEIVVREAVSESRGAGSAGEGSLSGDAGSSAPATTVDAWDCEDGTYLVTEFRAATDDVFLFAPELSTTLPHLRSASGGRYGEGEMEIWTKGQELTFARPGRETVRCSRNARASRIETSKLAGFDYWAMGNEPGWTLEIGPERIVWTTDYGQTRFELDTPEPEVDGSFHETIYRGELAGEAAVFTIVGERCSDDMSGEEFETRFVIEHGGRIYRGCGQALH